MADLDLVEQGTAGVAADNVLEVEALKLGREGVADLMRREEDAAAGIDADRVGELEVVGLDGRPYFRGGKLGGGGGVKQPADRYAGAEEFLPIGGVRKVGVKVEGIGGEQQAVAVNDRGALQMHLDADARQGAAFGEMQVGEVGLEELHLGATARPEGQGEGDIVAAFVLDRQNLAIGAVPELVFVHGIG